jgi:V-type sodium ATP synthase subunit J
MLSFVGLIVVGALLLMLPFAHQSERGISFFEALFTATSAVTVTGLSVIDMSAVFTIWGKLILLILIQFGGLGVLTIFSVLMLLIVKRFGFYTKRLVAEGLNHNKKYDIYYNVKRVVSIALIFEAIGAVFLFCSFIRDYSFLNAVFMAVFHSVSAFCNAGITFFPNSFQGHAYSLYVNGVIALLIIFGGIGFTTVIQMYEYLRKKRRRLDINSQFSILMAGLLLIAGTFLFFTLEYSNYQALYGRSFFYRLLISFFHSVNLRTAGFDIIPLEHLSGATILFCLTFMFIGASPNSAGSGVKTTTIGILLLGIKTALFNKNYIEFSKRRISWKVFNKASALVFITMIYVLTMIIVLTSLEPDIEFSKIAFELISAFTTCGLSTGITPELGGCAKLILIFTMFLGRVGPLTIALALSRPRAEGNYKYPKENILIG